MGQEIRGVWPAALAELKALQQENRRLKRYRVPFYSGKADSEGYSGFFEAEGTRCDNLRGDLAHTRQRLSTAELNTLKVKREAWSNLWHKSK